MTNTTNDFVDAYPYDIPESFRPGTTFAGIFLTAFISNLDDLKRPADDKRHTDKPKYAFSCSIPFENRKTFVRESVSVKFSCTEEDYKFLKSCHESLKFQPVNLVCVPDAWANSDTSYGIYYMYVSDSLRRFDGKLITEKK